MNVLFVCTGNTCRSPLAEKLLLKKAKEQNIKLYVKSAGLAAIEGNPVSKHAGTVLYEYGIDSNHKSTKITSDLLTWADLILTMTMEHKQLLIKQSPQYFDKIFTLKEYIFAQGEMQKEFQKLDKLYTQLELKKQQFILENKQQIEQLENNYQAAKNEMEQTEAKLNQYRHKLQELLREELRSIKRIEEKIPPLNIVDPFGGDLQTYREIAREIEESLTVLLKLPPFVKDENKENI